MLRRSIRDLRRMKDTPLRSTAFAIAAAAALAVGSTSAARAAATPALPASVMSSKTLTFCSAMTLPPMEFLSPAQKPEGVDIELGDGLAKRLGLHAKWINVPFAGLIPALQSGQCDAIMSQLFIKLGRLRVIDEIPYMYSREALLLKSGSPKIDDLTLLSGKKAATVTGTTATVLLNAANQHLAGAGKKPIDIVMFPDGTSALQQLQFGQVYAYGVAYETALYYSHVAAGQFELGGTPYYKIITGIGVAKSTPGLSDALKTELVAMMKDGSYAAVFNKWGIAPDMIGPKVVDADPASLTTAK